MNLLPLDALWQPWRRPHIGQCGAEDRRQPAGKRLRVRLRRDYMEVLIGEGESKESKDAKESKGKSSKSDKGDKSDGKLAAHGKSHKG